MGILTISQRIAPIVEAVLAQIQLKANLFHVFMDVLRRENSCLGDIIQQQYCKEQILTVLLSGGKSTKIRLGACNFSMHLLSEYMRSTKKLTSHTSWRNL